MKIHFTSDTHFGHRNQAERRGFASVEAMDDELVKRWNARVAPNDTVYHLGDLSFYDAAGTFNILRRINGQIKLVPGNHDSDKLLIRLVQMSPKIEVKPQLLDIKISNPLPDGTNTVDRMVLCHFPMLTWNRSHYGTMHLHGHSHGSCRYPAPNMRMLDVGVDVHELAPVSLQAVREFMSERQPISFDHHSAAHYNEQEQSPLTVRHFQH